MSTIAACWRASPASAATVAPTFVPNPPVPVECTLPDQPECAINQFCIEGFCCDQECVGGHCDRQGFEGVCIPGIPIGQICNQGDECESGFCSQNFVCCREACEDGWCDENGVCNARAFPGDPCGEDVECLSNVCDKFDLICCNRRCAADTEKCWLDDGPFKGKCVPDDFTPPPTVTATPTHTPDLSLTPGAMGALCSTPTQCDNGQCVNGVCCEQASCPVEWHCEKGTGQCIAGLPGTPTFTVVPTQTPNACSDRCSTNRCVNGGCVVSSSSGGCSVGADASGGNLVVLVLLPLALWASRRWQLERVRVRNRAPRQ
jgi:hypothetical protein